MEGGREGARQCIDITPESLKGWAKGPGGVGGGEMGRRRGWGGEEEGRWDGGDERGSGADMAVTVEHMLWGGRGGAVRGGWGVESYCRKKRGRR